MHLMEFLNSAISDSDADVGASYTRTPKWLRWSLLILAVWVLTPILNYIVTLVWPTSLEQLGQAGDIFGSINSLFSGLGLILVSITLWSQGEESKKERVAVEKSIKATESLGRATLFCTIFQAKTNQLAQYYAINRTKATLDKMDKMLERATQMLKEFGLSESDVEAIKTNILETKKAEDEDDS